MKAFLATTAVALLTFQTSYGQGRAVMKDSPEAGEWMRQAWLDAQLAASKRTKRMESGRFLFGVDERWTAVFDSKGKDDFAGTLFNKDLPDFRVGDWGCSDASYTVLQKLGDDSLLASTRAPFNDVVLLRGLDCSKVTDGVEFILQRPVFITGTHTYAAITGASRTVLLIECSPDRVSKLVAVEVEKKRAEARIREEALAESMRIEKAQHDRRRAEEEKLQKQAIQEQAARQNKIDDAKRRTWTLSDGGQPVEAKFVRLANGVVTLQDADGKDFDIRWDRLSVEDQSFVRQRKWLSIAATEPEPKSQPSQPRPSQTKEIPEVKPDPEKSVAEDRRSRWLNESYDTTVYRVRGTQWAELDNKTQKIKWYATETFRNDEFVEMYNSTRNQAWRFYERRMELRDGDRWKWLSNGRWISFGSTSNPARP